MRQLAWIGGAEGAKPRKKSIAKAKAQGSSTHDDPMGQGRLIPSSPIQGDDWAQGPRQLGDTGRLGVARNPSGGRLTSRLNPVSSQFV